MADSSIAPVKQAFVKALRDNATLKAAVHNEIHEGISPRDVEFPYLVYHVAWSVRDYEFGDTLVMRVGMDHWIVSDDQVEAHTLDALALAALQDKNLNMGTSGQSPLYCRRISDRSEVDEANDGTKVYQVGGTTEIWLAL